MSKLRQLTDLEKKLAERRTKREQSLREKHEQESVKAGLPPPPTGMFVFCLSYLGVYCVYWMLLVNRYAAYGIIN